MIFIFATFPFVCASVSIYFRMRRSGAPINFLLAIARTMGSDVTAKALQHQMPRLKQIGKLQLQSLADGLDPKDLPIGTITNTNVNVNSNQGQKFDACFRVHFPCFITRCLLHFAFCFLLCSMSLETILLIASTDISRYFGQDSTPGGIGFQFRTIKQYAKSQKACADSGGDPQTLDIGAAGKGENSQCTYLATPFSLLLCCPYTFCTFSIL
jgi:hypothetical protein